MTDDTETETGTETGTDTSEYVAENSDASQPPSVLEERDRQQDVEWHCAQCGSPVADAHDLATHDCPELED